MMYMPAVNTKAVRKTDDVDDDDGLLGMDARKSEMIQNTTLAGVVSVDWRCCCCCCCMLGPLVGVTVDPETRDNVF